MLTNRCSDVLQLYQWMYNLCDYLTYQCVFFVFFSNNVGSYDLRSTVPLTSHNPT